MPDRLDQLAAQMKQTGESPSAPAASNDVDLWSAGDPNPNAISGAGVMAAGKGLLHGIGDLALGAGRGLYSTASALPAYIAEKTGHADPAKLAERERISTPANGVQAFGKGAEQAAEFLIPGQGEKKLIEMVPSSLRTAAKIAVPALSAGTVNAAQGGSFGTGAAFGAAGAGIGSGLKAMAPKTAESALGIRAPQRAFGKTPGAEALESTRGIRPETIAETGRKSMGNLVSDLEGKVDAASVRANKLRGYLQAPPQEVPLAGPHPFIPDTPGELIPAARLPQENITDMGTDMSPTGTGGRTRGVPGRNVQQMGSTALTIPARLQREAYMTSGTHEAADLPRFGPGIWMRRPEVEPMEVPPTVPNETASLRPARGVIGDAQSKAAQQEASTLHGQIGKMSDFLHTGAVSGEPIPENVTPRRMLDLKRGFSDEHLRWNPDVHDEAVHAGRQAYHAMDNEIDRLVPSAAPTNQRISSLIEVLRNADRESRQAGLGQRMMHRMAAHTGALTLGAAGAAGGYREGGLPGALIGGATGVLLPEIGASPEAQMGVARLMNKAQTIRPAVGAALQATKRKQGTGDQER